MGELCVDCEELGYCQILARKTARINTTNKLNDLIGKLNKLSGRVDFESTAEGLNQKDDNIENEYFTDLELREAALRGCSQMMSL